MSTDGDLDASVRRMVADENLDKAIERYAIYLGDALTLELHKDWKTIEDLLGTRFVQSNRTVSLSAFIQKHGVPTDKAFMIALLDMANEHTAQAMQTTEKLIGFYEKWKAAEPSRFPTDARPGISVLLKILADGLERHNKGTQDWEIQRCEKFEATQQRLSPASRWPLGLPLPPPDNEMLQSLPGPIMDWLHTLIIARHSTLEPVIKTLVKRRETKEKPRDEGTRDLLRAMVKAGLTTKDLATRLVEMGLDGGLDGKTKGSLANRVRKETVRLNTMLRNSKMAAEPGFPSIQYP